MSVGFAAGLQPFTAEAPASLPAPPLPMLVPASDFAAVVPAAPRPAVSDCCIGALPASMVPAVMDVEASACSLLPASGRFVAGSAGACRLSAVATSVVRGVLVDSAGAAALSALHAHKASALAAPSPRSKRM